MFEVVNATEGRDALANESRCMIWSLSTSRAKLARTVWKAAAPVIQVENLNKNRSRQSTIRSWLEILHDRVRQTYIQCKPCVNARTTSQYPRQFSHCRGLDACRVAGATGHLDPWLSGPVGRQLNSSSLPGWGRLPVAALCCLGIELMDLNSSSPVISRTPHPFFSLRTVTLRCK